MYLPKNVLSAGKILENLDYAAANVHDVAALIETVPVADEVSWLPFFFSGARFAKEGRIEDAHRLLRGIEAPNAFIRNYRRYIQTNSTVLHAKPTFSTTSPYDAWVSSNYYQSHYSIGIEMVGNALARTSGQVIRVMDVGVGNGVFAAGYLKLAAKQSRKSIRLVINDQSESMIAAARATLRPLEDEVLQDLAVCPGAIQNVDISSLPAQDWIFCGASLHHMPLEQKAFILTQLRSVTQNLMVLDFHCNHDIPRADSLELYYSVAWHYDYYIADVETSRGLTDEAKELAIQEVLLAEALKILYEPRERRVDYHMPAESWGVLLKDCGYKKIELLPVVVSRERMLSFLLVASGEERGEVSSR